MSFRYPVKTAILLTAIIFVVAYATCITTGMMDSFMGFFHGLADKASEIHWFLGLFVGTFPYTIWIIGTLNVFALLYALMNKDYRSRDSL